jgi:hypothetical protein
MKTFSQLRITLLSAVLLLSASSLMAQNRWGLELRGGAAIPAQELGDADLGLGIGFEAMLAYHFMPHLGVYGGWGWTHFNADESFVGTDTDFEETGYTFGLQFIHPIADLPVNYMIRAGGVYNHIEAENDEGDITADSGHGLGWQAEVGVDVPLNDYWSLRPSVRYRALSRELEVELVTTEVDLTYVAASVGFARSF